MGLSRSVQSLDSRAIPSLAQQHLIRRERFILARDGLRAVPFLSLVLKLKPVQIETGLIR